MQKQTTEKKNTEKKPYRRPTLNIRDRLVEVTEGAQQQGVT